MLHTEQSPRGDYVRRFGGCRCCCFRLFSTAEMIGFNVDIPSWAFARQCCHSSAIRLTSFFVQSTDWDSPWRSGYYPGLTPDKRANCQVFCDFRCPFTRQMRELSGIRGTVLGVRPAMLSYVGHSADFILRSVDDSCFRRLLGVFRYPFSR